MYHQMAGNSTSTTTPLVQTNGFEFHEFIDNENFDQFVNLIRGDQSDHQYQNQHDQIVDHHFDFGLINTCLVDNNQFGPSENFGFGNVIATGQSDPNSKTNLQMQIFNKDNIKGDHDSDEDEDEDGDGDGDGDGDNDRQESSATNNTSSTCKSGRGKADRSRTLVSERRRRGRMKEKLYALRALVPNITKMDKASIIGDAVLYVQDLQKQAKKLKDEISSLEASLMGPDRGQGSILNSRRIQVLNNQLHSKRIIQMDLFQVEERGFYLKLVCSKSEGVAASLYKMLESLTNFNVQNSNLASVAETFILTVTLNVRNCVREIINLPNLKLWVVGALVDQEFEFTSPFTT